MKDFIDKNKNLVIFISSLLILGAIFVSFQKIFFYSLPGEEKPIFLPATEEDVFTTPPAITGSKINLAPILGFAALLTFGAVGVRFFFKKPIGEGEKKKESFEERDKKRKEDIEQLQAMVEAFLKMNGVYPNPSQFEELKADLEPEPKDPLQGQTVGDTDKTFDYYYDNWDSKTNQNTTSSYRLWAFLENKDDPLTKDGKYLAMPETYGKNLEPSEPPYPPVVEETVSALELEEKPEEKMARAGVEQPKVATFVPSPQTIYLPAQDKITQILLIIFSVVVFIITIINAYMVYKLNQLTAFLMQLLGKGF